MDLLPAYQDIVDKTEVLHEYLVNNTFLAATNMTLLNYARNVDALFANKVCQVEFLFYFIFMHTAVWGGYINPWTLCKDCISRISLALKIARKR